MHSTKKSAQNSNKEKIGRTYNDKADFLILPSRNLKVFLNILHLLAGIVLIFLSIFWVWKVLGILLLVFHWKQSYEQHISKTHPGSVLRIWHEKGSKFGYETQSSQRAIGHLMGLSFKCPWFIIMILRLKLKTKTIIIPSDALPFFEYRLLCQRVLHSVYRNGYFKK